NCAAGKPLPGDVRLIQISVSTVFASTYTESSRPEIRPNNCRTPGRTSFLPVIFSTSQVVSRMKLGPTAAADRMNRKNVEGHTARPSRKANGRPRSTPYNPPNDPW